LFQEKCELEQKEDGEGKTALSEKETIVSMRTRAERKQKGGAGRRQASERTRTGKRREGRRTGGGVM